MAKAIANENKKTKTTRFRMTEAELQQLNEVCKSLNIEKSSMIRIAVMKYLAEQNINILL